MQTKTKATEAHTVNTVCSQVNETYNHYTGKTDTKTYRMTSKVAVDTNTIMYEVGPKYIETGHRHCNWKWCDHVGTKYPYKNASFDCSYASLSNNIPNGTDYVYRAYGINPFNASRLSFPSMPPDISVDETELASRMYGDLVGRVDSSFLALEDLAGLVSGNSVIKAFGGVVRASNMVAKSLRDLKRLRRAFGAKASLYNMWLSSKELVRQIVGAHLGYRFSFKTTLHDISQTCDYWSAVQSDVQRLSLRNGKVLHYTKEAHAQNINTKTMSGSTWRDGVRYAFPTSPTPLSNLPNDECPDVVLSSIAAQHASLHCWARVLYPDEYITTSRILQSRFGLDKPLSTLWAIVPCSFVIDYLFRVQDYLGSLDNQLNEYGVIVDIFDTWLLKSTTRRYNISVPAISWYYHREGIAYDTKTIDCPAINADKILYSRFQRYPLTSDVIQAHLGSLLRTDSERWHQRVGTGLELLLSRRLR